MEETPITSASKPELSLLSTKFEEFKRSRDLILGKLELENNDNQSGKAIERVRTKV